MEKTIRFSASLGVIAGYGHKNVTDTSAVEIAGTAWQRAAAEVFKKTGVYAGAVITPARTVYHKDWGCPVGGEVTVGVTGECNPLFTDQTVYKTTVIAVLKKTAKKLKQSTTQLTFVECEFEYLDFRLKEETK